MSLRAPPISPCFSERDPAVPLWRRTLAETVGTLLQWWADGRSTRCTRAPGTRSGQGPPGLGRVLMTIGVGILGAGTEQPGWAVRAHSGADFVDYASPPMCLRSRSDRNRQVVVDRTNTLRRMVMML